jgi:HK97 family phage major capsid protein
MAIINRNDATALIPEVATDQIIQDTAKASIVLSTGTRVRATTAQTRIPVMESLPTAYFLDGDIDTKPQTNATWKNAYVNISELAVIVPVPEAVLADAGFDIFGEIQPHLAGAFGKALDAAVLFGVNKPGVWGDSIVAGAVAAGNVVTAGTGVDLAEDISNAMGIVEANGYTVNGHLAPVTIKSELRNLRDINNNPIYTEISAVQGSTVYGSRITFQDNGAFDTGSAKVITGDWSKIAVAVRQDLTFKVLTEATVGDYNLAEQDMVALRAVMRVGFAVPVSASHLTGDDNRYPFAVVAPAGS